jgi:hypothetical protein
MATYQLRPMSVGEILDGAFVLMRRHFGALFTVAILCLGVPTALDTYLQYAFGQMGPLARPDLAGLSAVLKVIGYLLVTGAAVRIVSDAYLGRVATAGQALRFAVGKMWGIFLSGVASTIVICVAGAPAGAAFVFAVIQAMSGGSSAFFGSALLGLVLLALPIMVATGYAVVVQAVVLEQLPSAISALGRSWALTRGHRGKAVVLWLVVLALLILFFVAVVVVGSITSVMSPLLGIAAVAAMSVLLMLVYPLMSCVFTLLYYDLRVRKEAFDLELLSQQIGLAPTGA